MEVWHHQNPTTKIGFENSLCINPQPSTRIIKATAPAGPDTVTLPEEVSVYLTECIYKLVLESRLLHKILESQLPHKTFC